jgi:hypothetical protein
MDVHKDSIAACSMTSEGKEFQTFSTKTVFILQLIDWIKIKKAAILAALNEIMFLSLNMN